MFRRLFRIGFGGCGCALEQEFRDHAVKLTRELLVPYYLEDLEKWERVLDNELFKMDYLDDLRPILSEEKEKQPEEFFEKDLDKVSGLLYEWKNLLTKVEKVARSYDVTFINKVRGTITNMRDEAISTKRRGSVLLESLPVDSFTETDAKGKSERFYVYNQDITETRELIVDQLGQVVIESQGFNHQPELQMLPFSIKEVRDEVFKKITETIKDRKLKDSATGGFLFFVGLGGGTGTGVISPLAEKFGKGSLGYFTVAVLGGKDDDKVLQSQKPWFRRCFNMLIALNDLIVTAELDGIILVDNDVIMTPGEKEGKSGPALMAEIDKKIIEKLYPAFGITVLDGNDLDWSQLKEHIGLHTLKKKPPVIVPCYASEVCSKSGDNLELLIEEALKDKDKDSGSDNGKLAPCEDFKKAKRVFVYVRCITDEKKVRDKLAEVFGEVSEENKYKNIAILKDYLFCWDDVKEGNDKELKSSLKNVCEIGWVDNAEPKGDQNEDKLELCNPKNKNEKIIIKIRERELFNWDDVVQKNDGELKKYLEDCEIKSDSISMSDDKNAITILDENENEVATIKLNKEENKATLEWDNKGNKEKRDLKVKKERKVYLPKEAELFTGKYLFNWDDVVQKNDSELKKYLKDCKIEFDEIKSEDKTITISKGQQVIARITLNEEKNIATFEWDKEKRDLKVKDRGIYDYLIKKKNPELKVEDPELKVETVKGKRYVYLKKCQATRNWIKNNVEKRIVVFESQEIGSFWHDDTKKNEVLILLFNPNVKDALSGRLLEAKKFVNLLVKFKDVIEDKAENGSKDKLDVAKDIIKQINDKGQIRGNADLTDLKRKEDDIKLKENIKEEDKPLSQAKDFLFPKELYDKDKEIYDRMVKILDRLKSEVRKIPKNGDEDWWPIFKENIFDIISTSGKRDEVILSAIEALEDQNKFNKLVGKGVYDTYFEIFKRQYFKYNAPYLYPGVGEHILSDAAEQELPVALKKELDEKEVRITGDDLKVLVKNYTIEPALLFSFLLYLFSWDDVLRNDSEELLLFLRDDLDVGWAENVEIRKSDDGSTIHIFKDENSAEIMMDEKNEKVTLKISDGRIYDLKVKTEKGKLNIYGDLNEEVIKKRFTDVGKKKKIELSNDCIFVEGEYWFTWEKVNGVEEYTFRERLTNDCKLEWAKKAKIVMDENAKNKIVVSNEEESKYWFSWDDVLRNDSEKLLIFLRDDLDVGWAKNVEIRKSDDGSTIHIFKDENSAEIMMDEKNEKVTLKISDGRIYDLKVKTEKGKLNIYESKNLELTIPDSGNDLTINDQQLKIKTDGSKHYIYKKKSDKFTIIDGAKSYSAQENKDKIDVYSRSELSYPAMLAVAGLYAEWEQVGSWNYDEKKGFVLAGSKADIIKKLFKEETAPGDFEDYVFSKESTIKIPDKDNLLIINADEEDATLVIRKADKNLLQELTRDQVYPDSSLISQGLEEKFKEVGIEDVNNDNYKVTDGKLEPRDEAIKNKKLYRHYYIRENAGKYSIDGDKILKLKVKKEEGEDGKTLKIYKKRGEYFKAAE